MNMLEIINNTIGNIFLTIAALIAAKIIFEEDIKIKRFDVIASFVLVMFLQSVAFYYLDGDLKSLSIMVLIFMLTKIIFNISYSKAIFLVIIYEIIMIISEMLCMIFVVSILNISINSHGNIIPNISVAVLSILITIIFKKQLRDLISIKITSDKLIIIFSILIFICISIVFYYGFNGGKVGLEAIISIIIMLIFISVLCLLIKEKINNIKLEAEYDILISAMEDFEEELNKQKIIHHENKNQLLIIKALIIDNEPNEKVTKYINSVLKDETTFNQKKYAKFKYLPPNGIKGLFYFKILKAEKLNITINIDISRNIKKSIIYNLDVENYKQLGRLLGVYLDNAIEASYESEDKLIGIEMKMIDGNVIIIIFNTYAKGIDLKKVGIKRFSTKGRNRGYGLSLARKIINSNEIFVEEKEVSPEIYTQKLIIKKSITK